MGCAQFTLTHRFCKSRQKEVELDPCTTWLFLQDKNSRKQTLNIDGAFRDTIAGSKKMRQLEA